MMSSFNPLLELVSNQKKGNPVGIASYCTANEWVIKAVMEHLKPTDLPVLIEATANQVNQYGGYTGMRPKDFRDFVLSLAEEVGFPKHRVLLGGDHLGPLTWKSLKEADAMKEAHELIREFVLAGFTKIHIDTSMRLGDDSTDQALDTKIIAQRGAELAVTAEAAFAELRQRGADAVAPVYVVGSEVPTPGGAQDEEEGIHVTTVENFYATIETFRSEFETRGLNDAWRRVIAVVVQPGVEFGDDAIHEYNRDAALDLCKAGKNLKGVVFEGHSTDYQTPKALKKMVEDGIAILKVGPALTFALREALFALNMIEREIYRYSPEVRQSNFIDTLDEAMLRRPQNWSNHYRGAPAHVRLSRKYSFSDRARYDLVDPEVKESLNLLLENLASCEIPLSILSQYMPVQYLHVRDGLIKGDVASLIKDRVLDCVKDYLYATAP